MTNKILHTFGTKFLAALINLAIAIIISQVLGPEGKGQQGLILASIAYILVFANIIGGAAIVYLTPRYSASLIIAPAYLWALLMSVFSFFLLKFVLPFDNSWLISISLLSVINAFSGINSNILIGKEHIKAANTASLLQPILLILSLLINYFIIKDKSIDGYLNALYFSFGWSLFISFYLLKKKGIKSEKGHFSEYIEVAHKLLKYGILNQLAHIFQLVSFRMSYYWLNASYTESEVGVYSNGVSLIESVWLISRSICMVQYAAISNLKDNHKAQILTINLTKAAFILSLIVLIPLIFIPSSVYEFVFGQGFADVQLVIQALAPGVLFFNLALILDHYFSGIGKFHINTIAAFAGMIIALAGFYFLIPIYGISGAGWASSLSYFFTFVIVLIYFIQESGKGLGFLRLKKEDIHLFISELKLHLFKNNKQ